MNDLNKTPRYKQFFSYLNSLLIDLICLINFSLSLILLINNQISGLIILLITLICGSWYNYVPIVSKSAYTRQLGDLITHLKLQSEVKRVSVYQKGIIVEYRFHSQFYSLKQAKIVRGYLIINQQRFKLTKLKQELLREAIK